MFAPESRWEEGLNAAQLGAATYAGPRLLIVAGAGTGKTKTLACRVAHLVDRGARPDRLLLLTFTRRAAGELVGRVRRMTRSAAASAIWGGTFHSVGSRLLRMHGTAVGIPAGFTVLDHSDSTDLMSLVRTDLGFGKTARRFPRKDTLAAIYSRSVNAGEKLGDVVDKSFPWCRDELDGMKDIFEAYTARKRDQAVLDYDDLLLYWDALLHAPRVGEIIARSFDHILVDEYQDTNRIQARILSILASQGAAVTVVGDDAQAIYSFRAATVANILEFPDEFPGAEIATLEQNYRSTQPILDVSNAVIEQAGKRYDKKLWCQRVDGRQPVLWTCADESEQADRVCDQVLAHREDGVPLQRQAVLFRTGHHSALLEIELGHRNIPFVKFGGLKFIEAAHVKDLLAFLRVADNPSDELAWFRVLQMFDGIGPAIARRMIDEICAPVESPEVGPAEARLANLGTVPSHARAAIEALRDALADCRSVPPAPQVERARRLLEPLFERRYEDAAIRARDLEQLERIATGYSSRAQFITELTLDPPAATSDLAGPPLLDDDYLILSTIHSAKGCEWDVVHVINAADGSIPSDMALSDEEGLQEELRLFYVALTRARDSLHVYFPLRFYRKPGGADDRHMYGQVSRFLTDKVRHLFEERASVIPAPSDEEAIDHALETTVSAYLTALWS